MSILEKANELMIQVGSFATVSLGDFIGSVFMRTVLFLVDLMLGL